MPHRPDHSSHTKPQPCRNAIRPHDLLWLADPAALIVSGELPEWATTDLIVNMPVVVRRQKLDDIDLLPVGLRGTERNQRLAAYVKHSAVTRCVRPEALAQHDIDTLFPSSDSPALLAMSELRPTFNSLGLPWGPTGSAGFALATGLPVLRAHSDLDLVLHAPSPLDAQQTALLSSVLNYTDCRIDLQIDTGAGGFSFAEWIAARGRVLLKTDRGPLLTDDPWHMNVSAMSAA